VARAPRIRKPEDFISSVGVFRAVRHLRGMQAAADDPRPFWRKLQDEIAKEERHWFETSGHGAWPPLADSTRERKAALGLNSRTMVATGALVRSLTVGHQGKSRRVGKTIMHFGTSVYYANMHAKTRPVLIPTDTKFRSLVKKQLAHYVVEPTTKAVPDK
jgi:hypothetical protein